MDKFNKENSFKVMSVASSYLMYENVHEIVYSVLQIRRGNKGTFWDNFLYFFLKTYFVTLH